MPHPAKRAAYTLIEVLTAVAIIAILVGILMPAINSVRQHAQRAHCANNLQLIAMAGLSYQEVNHRLPCAVNMGGYFLGPKYSYAKPATTPTITDASGIPPGEMLRDLLGPVLDSPTRRNSDPRYPFGPNWAVYILPYIDFPKQAYANLNVEAYDKYWKEKNDSLLGQLGLGGVGGLGGVFNVNDLLNTKGPKEAVRDTWRSVSDEIVPVYRCPTDTFQTTAWAGLPDCPGTWARGNYAANAGPGWWQMSLQGASYQEAYGMTGPVMGIDWGAVVKQLPDGASTTVMFNEVRSGVTAADPRGAWALGFPGSSVTASNAIGDCVTPNDRGEGSDDVDGCPKYYYPGIGTRDRIGCSTGFANLGWPSWQAQARSLHRGGVNVAFCDGSVRFIHDYVSQPVWFSMLSSRDGVTYSFD